MLLSRLYIVLYSQFTETVTGSTELAFFLTETMMFSANPFQDLTLPSMTTDSYHTIW